MADNLQTETPLDPRSASRGAKDDTIRTRSIVLDALPYVVTALAICIIWSWHLTDLGSGNLGHYDEYYTYDRSQGFARQNDWWAVYSNNLPSLKKPPLQYWMSGLFMEMGVADILALRLSSMMFAFGCLVATALLARVMIPEFPWAMLPAVVLLASSLQFWRHATSAMLDVGAAMFATLGIAAMLVALAKPKYWPLFGVTAVLAALQKSPTPLGFLAMAMVMLFLTSKWQDIPPSAIWQNRTFRWTILVSVVLAFAWPLFQEIRFAFDDSLKGSIGAMLDRFAPSVPDRGAGDIYRLILGGDPWLRLLGLLGLCVLPFTQKRPMLLAATGIAVFFVFMMWIAAGKVYARYTLLVLPLLMVGAVGLLTSYHRTRWAGFAVALGLGLVAGGPFKDHSLLTLNRANSASATPHSSLLQPLGEQLRPEETLVVCGFGKGSRFPPGAVSVYASQGRIFIYLRKNNLRRSLENIGYASGPLRGICGQDALAELEPILQGLETSESPQSGTFYWTATGLADPGD